MNTIKSNDQKKIANRLKLARIQAGFNTAKDFAERFNIPNTTYTKHENGSRGINYSVLQKYADLLDIQSQWLISGGNSLLSSNLLIDKELLAFTIEKAYYILKEASNNIDFKYISKIATQVYESVTTSGIERKSQETLAEQLLTALSESIKITIEAEISDKD